MKKNKGITLIALIITIILLLILVGVSINLAIKGNLFGSAEKAVSATNDKVGKQQSIIDELMDEFDAMEAEICSHIWKDGAILKESTCTAEGKKQKVCENCKKVIEIETPALGHNFVNRVCTRCGEKEPGCTTHTYGEWVITKNATCVAEGSKKRTCTVCGVEEIENNSSNRSTYIWRMESNKTSNMYSRWNQNKNLHRMWSYSNRSNCKTRA